jgi:steroid 5-alpha reductase family enzyme
MYLVSALVFIWAIRLSIYLAIRKKGEDYRYKEMR